MYFLRILEMPLSPLNELKKLLKDYNTSGVVPDLARLQFCMEAVPREKSFPFIANLRDRTTGKLMQRIAVRGDLEILTCLLGVFTAEDRRALLMVLDNGCSAVSIAALEGHTETVKFMLNSFEPQDRFKLLKLVDVGGKTPVYFAAYKHHTATLKCLLDMVHNSKQRCELLLQEHNEHFMYNNAIQMSIFNGDQMKFVLDSVEPKHQLDLVGNALPIAEQNGNPHIINLLKQYRTNAIKNGFFEGLLNYKSFSQKL